MSSRSRVDALIHVWKYLEPTKKAIEVAEVSDEEKKEEYPHTWFFSGFL